MKKSVIILIAIIYIAAIPLVNILGLKDKQYNIEIDVTDIVLDESIPTQKDGHHRIDITDDDGDGVWEYQIAYAILPENATDKSVTITQTTAKKDVEIDEETGTIRLHSRGLTNIKIEANGSSGLFVELMIVAK